MICIETIQTAQVLLSPYLRKRRQNEPGDTVSIACKPVPSTQEKCSYIILRISERERPRGAYYYSVTNTVFRLTRVAWQDATPQELGDYESLTTANEAAMALLPEPCVVESPKRPAGYGGMHGVALYTRYHVLDALPGFFGSKGNCTKGDNNVLLSRVIPDITKQCSYIIIRRGIRDVVGWRHALQGQSAWGKPGKARSYSRRVYGVVEQRYIIASVAWADGTLTEMETCTTRKAAMQAMRRFER